MTSTATGATDVHGRVEQPQDRARAAQTGAPPGWTPPTAPPGRARLLGELATVRQPLRLLLTLPALRRAPRGDGGVVLALPGFRAPEVSMLPVVTMLRRLGHDARGWGLGTNTGTPERDRDTLLPVVEQLASDHGPVALVGWSLGGVVARELARDARPGAVRAVVTYGTPAVGGPTFTVAADVYGPGERVRILALTDELDRDRPIAVPVTSIVSRRDTIVDWRAQVDVRSTDVRHVEVDSTHLGMGIDPDVLLAVADALASTDGRTAPRS